jgi:hypothetical protein
VPAVASAALHKVRQRFDQVHTDPGFQAAFGFILALTTPPGLHPRPPKTWVPTVDLSTNPSVFRIAAELRAWVDSHASSLEYAELSKRAAADAVVFWTQDQSRQHGLFGPSDAAQIWGAARHGGAFSDLCRVFFGKFTERYLKYFLDREASSRLPTVEERDRFAANLERHVAEVARHSFEATKITQSFAAGWYNKHARQSLPSSHTILGFLSFAMGKLRQELLRESPAE